jgi:hypothetical protein
MGARFPAILLLLVIPALGATRKPANAHAMNETVDLSATLFADRENVKEMLGSDLDGHYIVVEVKVSPKYGKEIEIDRDNFILRTDRDGERTKPFAPSQVAGRGALVVSQTAAGGGAMMGDNNGPIWGGIPGTGGRPRRMGGDGGAIGNSADAGGAEARMNSESRSKDKDKANPLLDALQSKMLPAKKTDQPVSGLLYFPMEKQKIKDLELVYNTAEGKLSLRFR